MLKNSLIEIENQLNQYSNIKRSDFYQQCINDKLKNTLNNYLHIIEVNSDYLLSRNSIKVLKALTKEQKKEDKKALKKASKEQQNEEINNNSSEVNVEGEE